MNEELGPFHNRPEELELFNPLVGSTMLELGNKRNLTLTYKKFFEDRGYAHTSVDWNGQDGALKLDLQSPLALGTFDVVSNIGTTEHVGDQHGVWQNICAAMHLGSVFVSATPKPGNWPAHGQWYPTQEFFKQLAARNGLQVDRIYEVFDSPRTLTMVRLTRVAEAPFFYPNAPGLIRAR